MSAGSASQLPSTNSAFNAGAGAVEGSTANFAPPGCPICPCPPKCAPKDVAQALFKVPVGFQALLKHITRELLNGKPKDPYLYICEYLRVKMHDRRRGTVVAFPSFFVFLEEEWWRGSKISSAMDHGASAV